MKRCPVCAELLADGLTTCPYCGEILENNPTIDEKPTAQQATMIDMVNCPICGESIPSGLNTCPICGEAISFSHETTAEASPETQTEPTPSLEERSEEMITCPVCGEMISSKLTTCPYCSEPIESKTEETPSTPQQDHLGSMAAAGAAAVAASATASNLNPPPPAEPIIDEGPQYTPEPTPQYTPEPTPQYTPEPTPQYAPEPTPQYTPEPTPAPSANYGQYGDQQANTSQGNEPPYIPPVAPQQKGGGMKWLLIALIALLALALGGVLYYFLSKDKDKESDEGNPTRTETTINTDEETDEGRDIDNSSTDVNEAEDTDAGGDLVEEATTPTTTTKTTTPQPQVSYPSTPSVPKTSARPDRDYDGSYDDVGRNGHRHGGRFDRRPPRDGYNSDDYGRPGPPPRHGRDGNRDVAPPNSSSTGFHLEPQNGSQQQGNRSNNNSGFKLQQVDRIPNE